MNTNARPIPVLPVGEFKQAQPDGTPAQMLGMLLDSAYEGLRRGCPSEAMERLVLELRTARLRSSRAEWQVLAHECLRHPLCEVVHGDPFTRRAFDKPRGYAGDAVMLDYIYDSGGSAAAPPLDPDAARIHEFTTNGPSCKAVRFRRQILARRIDKVAARGGRPRVLSIAAGHARELDLSEAFRSGAIGEFVALDQDELSLEGIRQRHPDDQITLVHAGVREILGCRTDLGQFDLVYATGLFDYLGDAMAARLTEILFSAVKPTGRLLIANFLPGIRDVGYMESFMAWELIYRSPSQLAELARGLNPSDIRKRVLFLDQWANVGYLEVLKN